MHIQYYLLLRGVIKVIPYYDREGVVTSRHVTSRHVTSRHVGKTRVLFHLSVYLNHKNDEA